MNRIEPPAGGTGFRASNAPMTITAPVPASPGRSILFILSQKKWFFRVFPPFRRWPRRRFLRQLAMPAFTNAPASFPSARLPSPRPPVPLRQAGAPAKREQAPALHKVSPRRGHPWVDTHDRRTGRRSPPTKIYEEPQKSPLWPPNQKGLSPFPAPITKQSENQRKIPFRGTWRVSFG